STNASNCLVTVPSGTPAGRSDRDSGTGPGVLPIRSGCDQQPAALPADLGPDDLPARRGLVAPPVRHRLDQVKAAPVGCQPLDAAAGRGLAAAVRDPDRDAAVTARQGDRERR